MRLYTMRELVEVLMKRKRYLFIFFCLLSVLPVLLCSCSLTGKEDGDTVTVIDQMGRKVTVPKKINRIAALHHAGGKIVFALGLQDKLVDQALYHYEAVAMAKVDKSFASRPKLVEGHSTNNEGLISLKPDVAIAYASFDPSQMDQLEQAGVKVVAIKGETLEESYAAVRLVAKVLGRESRGEQYIADCEKILSILRKRIAEIPPKERLRVMFVGPKNIYTAATGSMMQSTLLETAGGVNVASDLRGFWASVSPEQIVSWNPDVILLGSSLATYGTESILSNPQFRTISAVKNRRVYVFPSNVGWWDYPAPHCVLGTLWTAKTLYPERFRDIDVLRMADDFYKKYLGHSFTEMGGRL
jgi:iron complex transport system substrate-binding protein